MNNNRFVSLAFILTIASFLGKLLGFVKDVLISYYYGTSPLTDAIFLALAVPTIILGVFTSASDSAIIPQYNRIYLSKGREKADENFSNIVNVLAIIGLIISFLILLFPSFLIKIFAPGFFDIQKEYSIKFLRLFSFFGLMHIIFCFFSSYITRFQHIWARSVLAFSTNVIVIIALLINPDSNMLFLSFAFTLGYIIQAFLPFFSAKQIGYQHKFYINIKDKEYVKFVKIFMPIMGVALIQDLNMFVDRFLASNMEVGSVSALNYASRLTMIFDTLLVVGIGVLILPVFSKLNLENDMERFTEYTAKIIKYLTLILLPVCLFSILFYYEIIEVVYMRGKFDINSVKMVSVIFLWFAPQILILPVIALFSRFFHSMENTKTPFKIHVIGILLNIIFSIVLSKIYGLKGIAIGASLSSIFVCIFLFLKLKKEVGWAYQYFGTMDIIKIIILSLLIIGTIYFIKSFNMGVIVEILISFFVTIFLFMSILYIFYRNELNDIYQIIKKYRT